ncbi:MAG: acetyl-CoA C-acetyltransferase [Clostridia bacterium]|nr:acetyl-CoA C-acetyltransferase [Clostridia bacterium]
MTKTYIVGAKRSAVGSFLGTLKDVSPAAMGSEVVIKLMEEVGVDPKNVDELICGNILSANLGQGIARQIAIKAGIPEEVCAYSLNMLCGSGMKAVLNAVSSIQAGYAGLIVAGGVESMSGAPMLMPGTVRSGSKMGDITMSDHMIKDALTDAFSGVHMGITAENIAEKYQISRQEQDEFAWNSQQKAIKAIDEGKFKDEIVPLKVQIKRDTVVFDTDEFPNRTTNLEKLSSLRAAFKKDGTVTAGNASGINDGASFVIVASEEAVKKYNLEPMAEIVGIGQGGVDPQYMGLGPVPAVKSALKNADKKLGEMDLIELNEAFAAQSLGVVRLLSANHNILEEEIMAKTNVNGGAIALGHPVGASGNRILVTLVHEMKRRNSEYGLASLCIGGGMGTAIILRKIGE